MNTKIFKMDEKQYGRIKDLSDKDFGKLMKSVCGYVYYAKATDMKDKLLNAYFESFRDKIDEKKFYQEAGLRGAIKTNENRKKDGDGIAMVMDIVGATDRDDMLQSILETLGADKEKKPKG